MEKSVGTFATVGELELSLADHVVFEKKLQIDDKDVKRASENISTRENRVENSKLKRRGLSPLLTISTNLPNTMNSFLRTLLLAVVAALALFAAPGHARRLAQTPVLAPSPTSTTPQPPVLTMKKIDNVNGVNVTGMGCLLEVTAEGADEGFMVGCVGTGVSGCPPVVPYGSGSGSDVPAIASDPADAFLGAGEPIAESQAISPDASIDPEIIEYPAEPACDLSTLPDTTGIVERQFFVVRNDDNCQIKACRGCLCTEMVPLKCPAPEPTPIN
jgi:hypothetical protein